jgi:hypothetical protein
MGRVPLSWGVTTSASYEMLLLGHQSFIDSQASCSAYDPQHVAAYLQYIQESAAEAAAAHLFSNTILPLQTQCTSLSSELQGTKTNLFDLQVKVQTVSGCSLRPACTACISETCLYCLYL